MLMILVAGASSVTSVWRLSCHRPTTFAFLRNFVHAALNVVTGRVTFSTFCLMNRQNLHPTTCGSPRFHLVFAYIRLWPPICNTLDPEEV